MNVIDAAHKTVHNVKHGGSTAIAARMGMSSTVLNNKVNPNTDSHHLRLDEALTIMEYTNDHGIIQAMAQRLGGVFCTVEGEATQASILMTALSTSACQGDIMSEMQKALEDGRIDCKERHSCPTNQDSGRYGCATHIERTNRKALRRRLCLINVVSAKPASYAQQLKSLAATLQSSVSLSASSRQKDGR